MSRSGVVFDLIADDLFTILSTRPAAVVHLDAAWNGSAVGTKADLLRVRDECCPRVEVRSMDVDVPRNGEFAAALGVTRLPAIAVFVDGERRWLTQGFQSRATLKSLLTEAQAGIPWYW